jgi:hypothetical protein
MISNGNQSKTTDNIRSPSLTPEQAERLGMFTEDAITLEDAIASQADLEDIANG